MVQVVVEHPAQPKVVPRIETLPAGKESEVPEVRASAEARWPAELRVHPQASVAVHAHHPYSEQAPNSARLAGTHPHCDML